MARSLYICYFGLREPLVQTQVLPYLRELKKDGHELTLLTFEPEFSKRWSSEQVREERLKLENEGIGWTALAYHRRPSAVATAYDIFRGALAVRGLIRSENLDILHARVHVPALMGALARSFTRRKPKMIFDIRGFFPEEYTDAGIWPENGLLYRSVKRIEKWLMKEADGFVILTEKAKTILFPESADKSPVEGCGDKFNRPVEVIPCCVDFRRFDSVNVDTRNLMRKRLGVDGRRVVTYVGSFGGWYMTNETADLLGAAREKDSSVFALVLSQSPPEVMERLLRERGFSDRDLLITRVPAGEIPAYLSAADAAVSLIKPCYSKQSSSPTKNAEYLACGLPIVANPGIGDVDELIIRTGTGILLDGFDHESYVSALEKLEMLGDVNEICRKTAYDEFDLGRVGGERYRRLYRKLMDGREVK